MTYRPILFSAPMVRALLEGRKTQTRRIIKKQAALDAISVFGPNHLLLPGNADLIRCAVGDRLWVREACAIVGSVDPGFVLYRADGYEAECKRHGFDSPFPPESEVRWRSAIHMPRWASRLNLEVIDVRVERLQNITEEDAKAEGCNPDDSSLNPNDIGPARQVFGNLWDNINGPGAWDKNPWIAAYTFLVISCNIDQIEVTA